MYSRNRGDPGVFAPDANGSKKAQLRLVQLLEDGLGDEDVEVGRQEPSAQGSMQAKGLSGTAGAGVRKTPAKHTSSVEAAPKTTVAGRVLT